MDDEPVLSFIRRQFDSGGYIFSVCTGALLCGATGILRGRRATTPLGGFRPASFSWRDSRGLAGRGGRQVH
jgi:putative intracellular protease/amidase